MTTFMEKLKAGLIVIAAAICGLAIALALFIISNAIAFAAFEEQNNKELYRRIIAAAMWSGEKPIIADDINIDSDVGAVVSSLADAVVMVNAYKEVPVYRLIYSPNSSRRMFELIKTNTRKNSFGSGFFITADGYLITNRHVVADKNARYTISLSKDIEIPANVVYRDSVKDVAILKTYNDQKLYPFIKLGDSSALNQEDRVVSIGNALGSFIDSVSEGRIISLSQNILVEDEDGMPRIMRGLIQADAKLYPGDSGGPLLNMSGEAIAVNVATGLDAFFPTSFSIPTSDVKEVIERFGLSVE